MGAATFDASVLDGDHRRDHKWWDSSASAEAKLRGQSVHLKPSVKRSNVVAGV